MNDRQSTYCENIELRNEIFGKVLYSVKDWIRAPRNIMLVPFEGWVTVGMSDTLGSVQGGEFCIFAFILVPVYTAIL
jgi:hypothetical protein